MNRFLLLVAGFLPLVGFGQNLVPNPSFENGTSSPTSWDPSVFGPAWENFGHTGARSISITAPSWSETRWSTPNCPVTLGKPHTINFWTKATNGLNGYASAGFTTAFRNFFPPPTNWVNYSYTACIPSNGSPLFFLGQTTLGGPIYFDDAEVIAATPVHLNFGGNELGEDESFSGGRYTFKSHLSSYLANYDRCLISATGTGAYFFSSDRWLMYGGASLLYRHGFNGLSFTNVTLKFTTWDQWGLSGKSLLVDASTNGTSWQVVTQFTGGGTLSAIVPASLLPASQLYVRLYNTNYSGNAGQFSLYEYSLQADFASPPADVSGATFMLEPRVTNSLVTPVGIFEPADGQVLRLSIPNSGGQPQSFQITSTAEFAGDTRQWQSTVLVPPGTNNFVDARVPTAGFGQNTITISVRDANTNLIFKDTFRKQTTILTDDSYGYLLPSPTNCPAWWCEGAYKVGQKRAAPFETNDAVQISAARNEYEPFQLVLRPRVPLTNATIAMGDLTCTNGFTIAATNVTLCRVETVPITELYNNVVQDFNEPKVCTGNTPDPLTPVTGPIDVAANTNTPLWFTVYVPKDAPPGTYEATVSIQSGTATFTVPVRVRVRSFGISAATHTQESANVTIDPLWHQPTNDTQAAQILDLYLENMRTHRYSPFMANYYHPINWTYNSGNQSFTYNFTNFDAAMEHYLEDFKFTTFKDINEPRALPDIGTFPQFNASNTGINTNYRPLYIKLMQPIVQHFREQGWSDLAYSFWVDEPQFDNSQAVVQLVQDGMRMVNEAAPDLKRLVAGNTYNMPYPALYGDVDIWSPGFYPFSYKPDRNQLRQQAGSKIWPYCFVYPHPPWPNNLIDIPAISPRMRHWMHEKLHTDGEEAWGLNFYLGTFAEGARNPWTNPMAKLYFGEYLGNGDGTLLYPPTKSPPSGPVVASPINSIRWEMLREGVEDREYFWLLEQVLKLADVRLGTNHPTVLQARAARDAALNAIPWPPVYPYKPPTIYTARESIAAVIESLDDGAPVLADNPFNKSAPAGTTRRIQAEFLAWPAPSIQWQHDGTNVPGATSARLTFTNLALGMAGEYRAIASNTGGTVTSAVSHVYVLVTNQPPVVIKTPDPVTFTNGARTVLGYGISSLTPITYQWFQNGTPIANATNITLLLANLGLPNSGSYTLVASNGFGVTTSPSVTLSLAGTNPPTITSHPASQTIVLGQDAQFAVVASGTGPLSYQWYFNSTNLLAGATGTNLVVTNVGFAQGGGYQVVVSNVAGAVTSTVAMLTVQPVAPSISSQPTNFAVVVGSTAQFTVSAGGTAPLAYQWFFNSTNPIASGGTTLTLTNVQFSQAGNYQVIVTNGGGAITSAVAALTVFPPGPIPPSIVTGPTNRTVLEGQTAQFTVVASGTAPLGYQWFFNLTNALASTNGNLLTLTNAQITQAGGYHVIITNAGGSVTSAVATLAVIPAPPIITSQPTNQEVVAGQTAQFSVTASGAGPLSYQWLFNLTNVLAGGAGSGCTLTNVQPAQAGNYFVLVTNTGGAVTSSPALLQVYVMPNYTTEPPGLTGNWQGSSFVLTLAPDNRSRTVLVSTDLLYWGAFYTAAPSAAPLLIPVSTTNAPGRFFRVLIAP